MSEMPINPWLAKVTLEYRQNCDDEQLRRGYREYIRGGSKYYSWSDYVSRCALMDYVSKNPLYLMRRAEMPLTQHTRDVLNRMMINCLADLMQMTARELEGFFNDKLEIRQINKFLKSYNLELSGCKDKVYKLGIESVEKEQESYDASLTALIERAKQIFKANDNKPIMSRSKFKQVLEAFEQAERFARLHDCGVGICETLYYEYASFMEVKSCLFEGYRELAEHVDLRMIYYLYVTDAGPARLADGYLIYGNTLSLMSCYNEAMEQYKNALDIVTEDTGTKDRELWLTRIFNKMGMCYRGLKDYDNAIDSYRTALNYASMLEKTKEEELQDIIFHNLSETYFDMGDLKQAEHYRRLTSDYDNEDDDLDNMDDPDDLF